MDKSVKDSLVVILPNTALKSIKINTFVNQQVVLKKGY